MAVPLASGRYLLAKCPPVRAMNWMYRIHIGLFAGEFVRTVVLCVATLALRNGLIIVAPHFPTNSRSVISISEPKKPSASGAPQNPFANALSGVSHSGLDQTTNVLKRYMSHE